MDEIFELENLRNQLIFDAVKFREKGDYFRYVRALSTTRAINLYLDDSQSLRICNSLLAYAVEDEIITEEQREFYQRTGREKIEFLIEFVL